MQPRAGGCDLREPALDGRVNVLVARSKLERTGVELFLDTPEPSLDRLQLRRRDDARGAEAACVSDAAGEVVRIELVIDRQR